jgi:hypothetical protein
MDCFASLATTGRMVNPKCHSRQTLAVCVAGCRNLAINRRLTTSYARRKYNASREGLIKVDGTFF